MLTTHILTVRDENMLGDVANELQLSFDRIQVSVEDIITERVTQEVLRYNDRAAQRSVDQARHYLVQPTELEQQLNGKKTSGRLKPVDLEKQIDVALTAFANNGFFILVDDLQVEMLDQMVEIRRNPSVTFVKLTPLVGG